MRVERVGNEDFIVLDTSPTVKHAVAMSTLGMYAELLGTTDTAELMSYIEHMHENPPPEPDPVTGKNIFTDAYLAVDAEGQAAKRKNIHTDAVNKGAARLMTASTTSAADLAIETASLTKKTKQAELRVKLTQGKKLKLTGEARAAAAHIDSVVTTVNLNAHREKFKNNLNNIGDKK